MNTLTTLLKGLLLGAALTLTTVNVQAQKYTYESVQGDAMQSRIYTLKNGLKVYISVNKEKPRVQTYIAVRTGSRNDPAETTGLAHYLEHIMFKGTSKYGTSNYAAEKPYLDQIEQHYELYRKTTDPAMRKKMYHEIDSLSQLAAKYNIPNEYDKMMANIGGEAVNAYTSNDVTCYQVNIPSNELDTWAKIEAERFQNMVIRGFHTELEAVYEEYNMGLANDGRKMMNATFEKLFPNHPYGTQSTIGLGEHLKNPSITNIKEYFAKYYVPNNVAVCLAGDVDPDKTVAIIDKYFGNWKGYGEVQAPQYPALKPMVASDTTVVGKEAAYVTMAWRTKAANTLQNDTLAVINKVLNNGSAGIFDLNLNSKMKIQGAETFNQALNEYGAFFIIGMPNEGQTLNDVRQLILKEIDNLKKGNFSDDLIPSVINNYKRNYFRSLDNNTYRANQFVDAFIKNIPWKQQAGELERISKLTKADVVKFANNFFTDNFVTVFKEQGEAKEGDKVEKPAITPIPTNNDIHSDFIQEVKNIKPQPIQPEFVNFKKDMVVSKTKKGLPLLYKKNTQDGLFQLTYCIPVGDENDVLLSYASNYINYLGTDKLTNEQIKQKFYKMACDMGITVNNDRTYIKLSGLNENLPEALKLLNDYIMNAKVDKDAFEKYIALVEKDRDDAKKNQRSNFRALFNYGIYGKYNPTTNTLSAEELRKVGPQKLLDLLKGLKNLENTVMYYGPYSQQQLDEVITKNYITADAKHFKQPAPAKRYVSELTKQNEVYIAPYNAKNIYMVQLNNDGKKWEVSHAPYIALFNEYFGSSMNSIVFQELREARGLAYSAGATYISPYRPQDNEYFYTQIITQNDKMVDCVNQFNTLLNDLPQRDAAMEVAKQSLLKSLSSSRTTKFGVLSAYLTAQRYGLNKSVNEIIYEKIPTLNLQDIIKFAKENISNKPYRYIVLGDEKQLDMKFLEKVGPIKRLSTNDIFGK